MPNMESGPGLPTCLVLGVTEMIAEVVVPRVSLKLRVMISSNPVHPHPTMSEAVMEAVADAYGEVIHL